ncbi:MAG: hypothetical protein ACOX78_04915 [Lachnospiraceae bacterium]|jgi:hypothetical protein
MKKTNIVIVLLFSAIICSLTACQKAVKPDSLDDLKDDDFVFTKDFPDSELLGNMQEAITEIGMDPNEIDGFYVAPDWANGHRYIFQYGDMGTRYYIYVNQDNSIESINCETTDLKVYEKGYEPFNYADVENNPDYYANVSRETVEDFSEETSDDDAIILTDGDTGQYGELSDDGYVHFIVPAGQYLAESLSGNVKIAQVNINDEEDYTFIADFDSIGDTAEISVLDGYYLELTVNGQVKLTAE